MKYLWGLGALLLVGIWLFFPAIFNWWAEFAWHIPHDELKKVSDLGPLGDIYGSLNTLISSLALCAVAYSTVLQVNELKLARQTYIDQLNEAKYSNFSGLYYSLLQNKQQIFNNLKSETRAGEVLIGQHLFGAICTDFIKHLNEKISSKNDNLLSYEKFDTQKFFVVTLNNEYKGIVYSELLTYFSSYSNILNLINKADIKEEQKAFCIAILRDGMSTYEQVVLVAISSFDENLKQSLRNSKIIKSNFSKSLVLFIKKFHEPDMFENKNLVANLKNQTPT